MTARAFDAFLEALIVVGIVGLAFSVRTTVDIALVATAAVIVLFAFAVYGVKGKRRPCIWVQQDGDSNVWETDCKRAFVFSHGSPEDNDFKRCPFCGGEIQQVPWLDPDALDW